MAVFHENMLIGASGQGAGGPTQYQVSRSLRFNSVDSAYLSRTFGTPTTQGTFTLSLWCKRTAFGAEQRLLGTGATGLFRFTTTDTLQLTLSGGSLASTAVFRDPAAWYHILWSASGTTQTVYVNNVSVISGTLSNTAINSAVAHQLGAGITASFFNGYLAEIYFVDGQALTPSSFAQTDVTTGEWIPVSYGGTYGNNGFKLTFADNSATTSAALGKDSAGSNDWTPNGFSITAGVTNDSLVDTPTSYGTDTGAGGEVRGNYCILNPLAINQSGGDSVISDGGLDGTSATGNSTGRTVGTMAVSSGAWYWEVAVSSAVGGPVYCVGIAAASEYTEDALGTTSASYAYLSTAQKRNAGTSSAYGATYTNLDVIGVALDLSTGTLTFYKNGTSQGSAYTGLSGSFVPAFSDNSSAQARFQVNFGQRPFTYAAPSGHKALCDTNMSAPVIAKPSTAFDVVTYTGTGASLTPTSSLGFAPDLVWIKGKSGATDSAVYDSVRGTTLDLVTNSTAIESTQAQGLTSFNSNGFTIGTLAKLNTNTATYAGWCWDGGTSTVSNTDGTITSQVRASASAGISIIGWTGTGSAASVGHGLGVAPSLIITKRRSVAVGGWIVRHASLATTNILLLNDVSATFADATYYPTAPTSSVINIGTNGSVNANASTFVAYAFAAVAGFSAFGSYSSNGVVDGPYVHLGFRPRWILIKNTTTTATNWVIVDALREGYNVDNDPLFTNVANAEPTTDLLDITSTGFKIRSIDATVNGTTATHVYAAFAEAPFQYARAR